ncbi:hypothetical protein HK405_008707 [Cladochytrium tenue]|nr:hypothetical protein HK405_008707 [Cladochytrium tenue]
MPAARPLALLPMMWSSLQRLLLQLLFLLALHPAPPASAGVEDINSARFRLLAHNASAATFLFRGNVPTIHSASSQPTFVYDTLSSVLNQTAFAASGVYLPSNYGLRLVSLLNFADASEAPNLNVTREGFVRGA